MNIYVNTNSVELHNISNLYSLPKIYVIFDKFNHFSGPPESNLKIKWNRPHKVRKQFENNGVCAKDKPFEENKGDIHTWRRLRKAINIIINAYDMEIAVSGHYVTTFVIKF